MTREKMIEELTEYCQSRPVDKCSTCPIRRRLAQGFGCIRIKDRTDDQLAADMLLLPVPEPVVEPDVEKELEETTEPEQPSIKYMVTVNRDLLMTIKGKIQMLSRCSGVTITDEMSTELCAMFEDLQYMLNCADEEAIIEASEMIAMRNAQMEALLRTYDDMVQQNDGEPMMQEE